MTFKRGFTLVELLVVVAILGILAAVGIVSFGGFTGSAKENAAKANWKNVIQFMNATSLQCSIDSSNKLNLLDENEGNIEVDCSQFKAKAVDLFVSHFLGTGSFKNPYKPNDSHRTAVFEPSTGFYDFPEKVELGRIHLGSNDDPSQDNYRIEMITRFKEGDSGTLRIKLLIE